jgi:hypothetical protein
MCKMFLGHARSDISRAGSAVKLHHTAAAMYTAKHRAKKTKGVSQQWWGHTSKEAIPLLAEKLSIY